MRIKEAAVLFKGKIWTGKRHGQIIQRMVMEVEEEFCVKQDMQGFVTECGKFVSRWEAKKIAIKAGQLIRETDGLPLVSEDLY